MNTCVIIDDEPLAIAVLQSYVEKSGILELASTFTSPVKAFSFLEKNRVDLVFADIEMPKLTGIQLIKSMQHKPKFIITSAYREYALDGFELDVLDFLVKPISYDRFLKAVSKLLNAAVNISQRDAAGARFIFIREKKRMTKVFLDEIIYLESQRDYLRLVTDKNDFTTRGTISYYENWLPKAEFTRVHRSFIISIAKISHYSEEDIELHNGIIIPIGDLFRKSFRDKIQKHLL
ncbi:MAG: response regulator transcription factor [Ferruginibacter sp.]|nr:response regulator transcription factor [Ferruginibacter sp.]